MSPSRASARSVAAVVCLVGATAFVVLAVTTVPWSPVPDGVLDPVPASDLFTPEELQRAESFSSSARLWSWSSLAVTLALLCALGFTRAGSRLMSRLPGPWWWQALSGVAAILLAARAITLPLAWAHWRLRVENGLSTQDWQGWLADLVRSEAVEIAVTAGLVLIVLASARRWRTWWPAVSAGIIASLVLLGSFVYPLVVEPLFNDFEPLPEGELRTAINNVARAEGVPIEDVVVADASRRTTTLNAWVSGLGGTRRVVLYDNLVEQVPQDQVMAVVAHELAHARHDDVVVGTALGMAGATCGVGLLGLVLTSRRRGRGAVPGPASVPLLLALLAIGAQLAAPVENTISRRIELRADVDALQATEDPGAMERLQLELARRSLSDPTPPPLAQFWWGSHPTTLTRVALARGWPEGQVQSTVISVPTEVQVSVKSPRTASPKR